jgi:acetolactate synthase-1/2/3 large subunit
MRGGEAIVRSVAAHGVDTVFGLPGVQMYPVFNTITELAPEMRVIGARHEQGAAYMAFGYAKSTGRPGVFSVVPGPGVLNATAALSTAWACNTPVLCLTGQIPSAYLGLGRGHLHEIPDQLATLKTLTKWAARIDRAADAPAAVAEAFRQMQGGRPGPVSLEMCWDVMAKRDEVGDIVAGEPMPRPEVDAQAVAAAAKLIAGARNPLIFVGSGALHAREEVTELAELLDAPVTALRGGRGIIPEDDSRFVSAVAALELWPDTDLVIGIGSRLELPYMRWNASADPRDQPQGPPLVRIEIDAAEMARLKPDAGILADSADGLRELINAAAGQKSNRGEGAERVNEARARAALKVEQVQPQKQYLDTVRKVLPRDGFYVGELTQTGYVSYFGFEVYEPRTYVMPGFQGTLGYGFSTALGVKAANPDKAVVSLNGDGGFLFGVGELATAVQEKLGVVAVVFNNQAFGNVRRDQINRYGRQTAAELENPDFVKLAESFGAAGLRVDSPEELGPVLERALADDVPALIEVVVPRDVETEPWDLIYPGRG